VAVAGPLDAPGVVNRQRLEFADPALAGSRQPYHAAQKMDLRAAEEFIEHCRQTSQRLASKGIQELSVLMARSGFQLVTGAVLVNRRREPHTLEQALSSHALIHTAEGEFFRQALLQGCGQNGLVASAIDTRELTEAAARALHKAVTQIQSHLAALGKSVGPPWQQDQKNATLAAWMALAEFTTARAKTAKAQR
jgi:hypothetical protein